MTESTYERPVKARLQVALENGEVWDATPADLEKFGLVQRLRAYRALCTALGSIVRPHRGDLTNAQLNPIRELMEVVLLYPDQMNGPEQSVTWNQIVQIEKTLQAKQDADSAAAAVAT